MQKRKFLSLHSRGFFSVHNPVFEEIKDLLSTVSVLSLYLYLYQKYFVLVPISLYLLPLCLQYFLICLESYLAVLLQGSDRQVNVQLLLPSAA